MKSKTISITNKEIILAPEDIIISKTDLTGKITYANRTFMKIANYSEAQLIGIQHNLVRHPEMPRGAFKLLWDTLKSGQEFFGFVKNLTSDGNYYWVFANITQDKASNGEVIGYFSVRRKISKQAVETISPIYQTMLSLEKQAGSAKAPAASIDFLNQELAKQGISYEQFVLTLQGE